MAGREMFDDGTIVTRVGIGTAAATNSITWGVGSTSGGTGSGGSIGLPVPRRVSITTTTGGVGNTVRLRVMGRGRAPGAFAVQMALPTKAKFQVGPASGIIRVWVVAR